MSFVMQFTMNFLIHKRVGSVVRYTGFHSNVNNKAITTNGIKAYVPVADFYKGKSVMITGGTGFLGMVLVEKLLYTCSGIEKVFLLVREKKGVPPEQRLQELLNNPLFNRLKDDKPWCLKKLIPVNGDIGAANLGISEEHAKTLTEEVSFVFHVAASIKFNQKLRQALRDNVEGTMQVLRLCQRMKHIEKLVHISTAYAQCLENVIEEKVYPPPTDLMDLYLRLKETSDIEIPECWPNTYTFTKSLAEHYIVKNRGDVPIVIVRPSIVVAIEQGPLEGGIKNWYGATGIVIPIAKGLSRVMLGAEDNLVDLIPVDYVINLSIIAATVKENPNDVAVYNVCSSSSNPLKLRQIIDLFVENSVEKRDYIFPLPRLNFITRYKWVVMLITFVMTILPAHVADGIRGIRGKQPRYTNLVHRIINTRDSVNFFTAHSWVIKNDRVRSLFASLSPQDQQIFPCDPTTINWRQYGVKYYAGVRQYLERKKI